MHVCYKCKYSRYSCITHCTVYETLKRPDCYFLGGKNCE